MLKLEDRVSDTDFSLKAPPLEADAYVSQFMATI